MAKKPKVAADAADVSERNPNAVLVSVGHDEAGGYLTGEAVADELYPLHAHEVHIGGVPYVHVADDADGAWIYAPRNVAQR